MPTGIATAYDLTVGVKVNMDEAIYMYSPVDSPLILGTDADGNALLSPSELYAFLRWLEVPDLTAEDVVDFFELADKNCDNMIQYAEYMYVLATNSE